MNIDEPDDSVLGKARDAQLQADLDLVSGLLMNLVAIGSHLLKQEADTSTDTEEEQLQRTVVCSLFRRYLDQLDSCAILLREGKISSCGTLARVAIEVSNEFQFLLLYQGQVDEKARCYMMMDVEAELAMLRKVRDHKNLTQWTDKIDLRIDQLERQKLSDYYSPIRLDQSEVMVNRKGEKKENPVKWFTLATWRKSEQKRLYKTNELMDYLVEQNAKVDPLGFSLMSNFVHSSIIIPESTYWNSDGQFLHPIRNPQNYREFVEGMIGLTRPVFECMRLRQNWYHRKEFQIAMIEFNKRFKKLYP